MPERKTIERAQRDRRQGKSPSTQAGEFVREEMDHIREGKHGARSAKQAIAIGLSKARRAGVALPAPKGAGSEKTRAGAKRDLAAGANPDRKVSRKRSLATTAALSREGHAAASHRALAAHATKSARQRGSAARSAAARKAAKTRARSTRGTVGVKSVKSRAKGA
jgi:hypothetical protein